MSDTKKIKPGSGRKKGAYSFMAVPLRELIATFANLDHPIIVGRVWGEHNGFTGVTTSAARVVSQAEIENPTSAISFTSSEDK